MKRTMLVIAAVSSAVTLGLIACTSGSTAETAVQEVTMDSLVKRGSYLVNAMGCDDCHSPKSFGPQGPEVIEELRFSGYPSGRALASVDKAATQSWMLLGHDGTVAVGPWGASFAANLTSDETGIGNWTEEQFIRALREGKSKGLEEGRPLLPPMPWLVYRNLSDHDLKSIFAYLKLSKPVNNLVPAPKPLNELK